MSSSRVRAATAAIALALPAYVYTSAFAQGASPAPAPNAPTSARASQSATEDKPTAPALSRWFELQNTTLNVRYRFIDTSAGIVTTNSLQHRETIRGRVKFDKSARYAWNFGVFTQPFLLIGRSHLAGSNYLMGIYAYLEAYGNSDFGRGAAISLLMLLIVAALSVFYVRQMVRIGEVR